MGCITSKLKTELDKLFISNNSSPSSMYEYIDCKYSESPISFNGDEIKYKYY